MEKEYIRTTEHSVTLNVTGGKIDSFRELEKTNGTVRVYENGCIGIAGCLGEPNEEELTAKAVEALAFGIPYPCDLGGPLEREDIRDEAEIIPVPQFIPVMQAFLDRLQELCPKFAFSNKIYLMDSRTEYRNSAGRHLLSAGRMISIELIVQNRGSGNLFDTALVWEGTHFDADTVLALFKKQYDAFYTPVYLEPGRYPVVADPSSLIGSFAQHFVGDLYAVGASLLSGKLGEKVFSDKLTVRDDRNPETSPATCFFDAEGCVAEYYRPTRVENGVLKDPDVDMIFGCHVNANFKTGVVGLKNGTIMAVAGLLVAFRISDVYVGHIGLFVGRGAIVSATMVLTVLPQLLLIFDTWMDRTTFRPFWKRSGEKTKPGPVEPEQQKT